MGKINDYTNKRFGRLIAIRPIGKAPSRHIIWECKCDCGKTKNVLSYQLTTGRVRSCGCYKDEISKQVNTKHGDLESRLYKVWKYMRRRCNNPNCNEYKYYGAKGVKVCEEWSDYRNFKKWAIENGYDENAPFGKCTIDRINPYGDYEPDNCRWVDMKIQCLNKRDNWEGNQEKIEKLLNKNQAS